MRFEIGTYDDWGSYTGNLTDVSFNSCKKATQYILEHKVEMKEHNEHWFIEVMEG